MQPDGNYPDQNFDEQTYTVYVQYSKLGFGSVYPGYLTAL